MNKENISRIVYELKENIQKTGAATSQEDYEKAYWLVFDGLNTLEDVLENRSFLTGEEVDQIDEELFDLLVRFDGAYYFVYRLNERRIRDYKNIWRYAKKLYALHSFKERVDFEQIKRDYFKDNNPYEIYPLGIDQSAWEE